MTHRDPIARLDALQWFGIKLGLDKPRMLAERLGHPERAYPVVLIAGTNGKGSVAACVARALERQGYRTGLYTSPHLVHLEERFRLDGHPVDRARLDAVLITVLAAMDAAMAAGQLDAPATFFEVTTLAAFELFAHEAVEVAVIEVGLGGRFDATNIVEQRVGVVTSVSRDHENHLGHTLAAIAAEKAGIVKGGAPTVVGSMPAEADAVVRAVCAERGSPLVDAAAEVMITPPLRVGDGLQTSLVTTSRTIGPVVLGLRGRHQLVNAQVALATLETLSRTGLEVSTEAMAEGLATPDWPGRLQWVPLGDGRRLLLDGAHNEAGVDALVSYLAENHPRVPIVFGVMKDKAVEPMLMRLGAAASLLVCTELPLVRAKPAAELGALAASRCPDVRVAVATEPAVAIARAFDSGDTVVVAGSLYLVGHVLGLIEAGTLW